MEISIQNENEESQRAEARRVLVCNLGLVPYEPTWRLQQKLQRELIEGSGSETLLLCEHRPVMTLGTSASDDSLLVDREELQKRGVEIFKVERGGDITWHGPGQLLAYPILDLSKRRKDIGWYMRNLEEVVMRTLLHYGIQGRRIPGKAGVWIDERTKIASLGVKLSRWCSMHGLALNVSCSQEGFSLIHPCGFRDARAVSMNDCGAAVDVRTVAPVLRDFFLEIFNCQPL